MEKRIEDLDTLEAEAKTLLGGLERDSRATLITLSGELGAGKTTFAQFIAKALGVDEHVTSPTFVLEKIYELPTVGVFKRLIHIDAYRLNKGAELSALGFGELMQDSTNLILLEWPERVIDALPTADVSITLTPNPDGSRTMTYAQ